MASASKLELPERGRSYRIALTPLADAMFQLLIFFMLASSLTPYSLLTLRTADAAPATEAAPGSEPDTAQAAPPQTGETALWTIEAGEILVGGQSFGYEALPALAGALGTASAPASVILIVRSGAQVQDVTTVMEALQAAEITSVQVTAGAP